nr:cytochrome c oxidase subunit II [Nelidina sp. n.]
MATWKMISFQDPVSPIMEQLIMFNDHMMMIIIMISSSVVYLIFLLTFNKMINRMLLEGQMIEFIWTLIPAMLLSIIVMPSLKILYLIEEINKPLISIKAIGHQWYWSYEYSDYKKIEFESYLKPYSNMSDFRLLDVDNRICIPQNIKTRMLISSYDVIHSWTIPSLGIKIDGCPGRMNQGSILIMRPGLYFGQCSEICGSNHSFMPIVLESIKMKFFMNWVKSF